MNQSTNFMGNSQGPEAGCTGSAFVKGSFISVEASASGGCEAFVVSGFQQTFDTGLPQGTQVRYKFIASGGADASFCGASFCGVSAGVATPEGSSARVAYVSDGGTHVLTTDPITIGASGKVTVTMDARTNVSPSLAGGGVSSGGDVKISRGCDLDPITPQNPSGTTTGNGWKFDYNIGADDGLEVKNVFLGIRPLAAMMSVPYLDLLTSDFSANQCKLRTNSSGPCSSRLVDFQMGTGSVQATYVVGNIPQGTASCVVVTESFDFHAPTGGDHCEPSGNLNYCARFYPTVSYTYVPDDLSKHINTINQPLRLDFTVGPGGPGQSSALAVDIPLAGYPFFKYGNPMPSEKFVQNVINNGAKGDVDNFHQTYGPKIDEPTGVTPGCPTCVHIHWRWEPSILFPGFMDANGGNPRIPTGSTQSVDVAVVAYPDNQNAECSSLAGGSAIAGKPTVFWYCGRGNQDSDTFFTHGGFFNPFSGGTVLTGVSVGRSGFRLDHSSGLWVQTLTLTNNSGASVTGPIAVVLDSLSSNATLANAQGVTGMAVPLGSPYVFAPLDNSTQLGVGQSLTVPLQFNNPTNAGITYTTRLLSGGLP